MPRSDRRSQGFRCRLAWLFTAATLFVGASPADDTRAPGGDSAPADAVALGRRLFFDPNLSRHRTQSCATCHDPAHAFTDPRDNRVGGAVSTGDDGHSLGERNTPTATYARFSPRFHIDDGIARGGQFLDGRAGDLAAQAGEPPLNPVEMNMVDAAAVVSRLKENPAYVEAFDALYGEGILEDTDAAYRAMTQSIAAFQQGDELSSFDSRYDRHLRGELELTEAESLGMTLFFSEQFTNCNRCHQLRPVPGAGRETFSNYEYHNIGVPPNPMLTEVHGEHFIDRGLRQHPDIDEPAAAGRFKVPTLRNVAVTPPYMHNGVFRDLRTTVLFYNKYNSRADRRQINPETGERWADPEVPQNLSLQDLEAGPALDDRRVDALVAFMKALTDQRYEHLLPP